MTRAALFAALLEAWHAFCYRLGEMRHRQYERTRLHPLTTVERFRRLDT